MQFKELKELPFAMASQPNQLHFTLFPLMAPGHMIPMIDIAKLLAQQRVIVTIITTPLNADRFKPMLGRAIESGQHIRVLEIKFPCVEAGLPEGCENFDMLPSLGLASNFFVAVGMLHQEVEKSFEELKPRPSCMISDMGLPWTTKIANKYHIPRLVFHGTCCFSLLCSHNILIHQILDNITSESEYFVVPGLPDRIELTKAQLPGSFSSNSNSASLKGVRDQIREAEKQTYGIVVNTFEELEPEYAKGYRIAKQGKVWCLGPVSLCNKDSLDKAERGKKASIDEHYCLEWLNSFEPSSVLYACLGSLSRLAHQQLIELGSGLEASNRPFIWVLQGRDQSDDLEKWILEIGFEERTKGRGLLIRGWAPQVLILSHPAIGGFMTHCGWNSSLEGICAGVPMITWPLFAEQFVNEKLLVEVLKIGVSVGVEVPVRWGEEDTVGVLVNKDEVAKAIERVMDNSEVEGQERRKRATDLGKMALRAMEEGGSSHHNLAMLIQDIQEQVTEKSN